MNRSTQTYVSKSPLRVLLIEDNAGYAGLVHSILARSQHPTFEVLTATNLDAGLSQLCRNKFDVILLDMTLPDSSGMATLQKTMAAAADLPIVVMTGHDDERLVVQALQKGAQDYLIKGQYEVALLPKAIHYAIERKRGQIALRDSDHRFEQMIAKNADPMLIIDDQLVVRFANPAVAALFGRTQDAVVGTIFGFPLPREGQTSEIEIIDLQGRLIVAEMRTVRIQWEGISSHLASLRDITEHKYMLAELEQTRKQDLMMKDVFLSKVSHELRSPLSVIHQFTTILLDGLSGELNTEQQEHLDIIFRNVEALRGMIDDLLNAARTEIDGIAAVSQDRSANLCTVPECIRLEDITSKTLGIFRPLAAKKKITLTAAPGTRLPPVHADPQRIGQVLNNLLNNAIKFTPVGGTVHVSIDRYEKDPHQLCVSVQDNGPGVTHDEKEKIFEYLYQSDGSIDNSRKGLGIGLYICKEIIDRHQGDIWAESYGNGCTFRFTLPIFSLEELLAPILTSDAIKSGHVGIITIELFPDPPRKLNHQDEKVMSGVWSILNYCVLAGFDLVLPRMGRLFDGEVFFIVACSPPNGIEALIRRISGQMRQSTLLDKNDLVPVISSFAVPVDDGKQKTTHQQKFLQTISSLNQLIDKKIYQRRHAHGKEKNSNRR